MVKKKHIHPIFTVEEVEEIIRNLEDAEYLDEEDRKVAEKLTEEFRGLLRVLMSRSDLLPQFCGDEK
jgi:transcriptional regulator of NAD metabolism